MVLHIRLNKQPVEQAAAIAGIGPVGIEGESARWTALHL
jgi:hypothetical protein